jgi:hypothetical protein
MPMMHYPILCGCGQPGRFKIAAAWSDGLTRELKTYAISCSTCLAEHLSLAREKAVHCRLLPGESLGIPGVYELQSHPTKEPIRRLDLETQSTPSKQHGGA